MMRSLYAGVSGLKTHQIKMDVIGNNIANVNTVAYKSSSITFSELMYQTTQSASGPNATTGTAGTNAKQIGLGVKSGAISTSITTAGATQTTGNPFDIKITGDAFFVVSDGASNFFTRDGSFYVDAAGNLAMSSNGYNVMGWGVDETGLEIKKDTVTALRIMSAENMTYTAEATSRAYVSGIIDKNDTDATSTSGKTMNLTFYDNLGYSYTAKLKMTEQADGQYGLKLSDILDSKNVSVMDQYPDITLGTYQAYTTPVTAQAASLTITPTQYQIGSATAVNLDDLATGTDPVVYSDDVAKIATLYGFSNVNEFLDSYVEYPAGTPVKMSTIIQNGPTVPNLDTIADNANNNQITFMGYEGAIVSYSTSDGTFAGINGSATTTSVSLLMPYGNFSNITVDFATSTNLNNNGTSTVAAKSGDTDGYGTGRKVGDLSGVAIQNNGMIYASYDNGQTRLLGQIAVAQFSNPSGLEKEGDNLYSATLNSGEFDGIGSDVSADGGYMSTGVLEMSNVDLSSEFTEMITTQRGFQANSRIITVSDTMLEELVNLKR
ncbi:MAG: flagellar hook-basal body complex protein [Lachnospiraceae bacterium]|nr:flagellar hook-basal body complex protein [Lachnospiraceae bacterium]MDD3659373.1 flagellar hook-basal body complex protein [Lachnospiraceae bacterium]